MDNVLVRPDGVYLLIAPQETDDLLELLYRQTLFSEFMSRPHEDVKYLYRGRLFGGMTVEAPSSAPVVVSSGADAGLTMGGKYVVYGNPNIRGSPIRVPIHRAPCYVRVTKQNFEALRKIFEALSGRERRRVVTAAPWLREREMAWRMALNRAVPREMRSFSWDPLDMTQIHTGFYEDILSTPHDDVQFKINGRYYKGIVKRHADGSLAVFASDPDGPQNVPLHDAPIFVKTYGRDGTGPTLAALIAKRSGTVLGSFVDLAAW